MEVDELTLKIDEIVTRYSKEVEDKISDILERTADSIVDYIKSHAPKSGHGNVHLADSFVKQSFGSGSDKRIVIYSEKKGRLVHLIEFGYRHRSGAFVSARPFMRPAYDGFVPAMLEEIKSVIGGK